MDGHVEVADVVVIVEDVEQVHVVLVDRVSVRHGDGGDGGACGDKDADNGDGREQRRDDNGASDKGGHQRTALVYVIYGML